MANYIATGAGTASSNGLYEDNGQIVAGRAQYETDTGNLISWSEEPPQYFLYDATVEDGTYKTDNSPANPAAGNWVVAFVGVSDEPPPTVMLEGAGGSPICPAFF